VRTGGGAPTDAAGNVTYTYTDTNGAGTDTINASVTITGTTQHATASEIWTAAVNHPPVANNVSVTTPQNTAVGRDVDGDRRRQRPADLHRGHHPGPRHPVRPPRRT